LLFKQGTKGQGVLSGRGASVAQAGLKRGLLA
jgi:hypothetical protein